MRRGGAIANVLESEGYHVLGMDIVDRGWHSTIIQDFLKYNTFFDGDCISNPPYSIQTEFILKCLKVCTGKIALLLKLNFLETINRYENIFKYNPPNRVYVFVKRIKCLKNGFRDNKGSSVCYCWCVWDNSVNDDNTFLYWIPNHKY